MHSNSTPNILSNRFLKAFTDCDDNTLLEDYYARWRLSFQTYDKDCRFVRVLIFHFWKDSMYFIL